MRKIRIPLPGYNGDTDTNPDHFSVYADQDNVLIKRFGTGSANLVDPSGSSYYTPLIVNHNLQYIPLFLAYANTAKSEIWTLMNNQWNPFELPAYIAGIDVNNLNIWNDGGNTFGSLNVAYDIFYDDMSQTGAPSITETKPLFKIAKNGVDATKSLNPNDYIVHSNLNNFKILGVYSKSGYTLTSRGTGLNTFAHGMNLNQPIKYILFITFPDGKTTLCGGSAPSLSYDENYKVYSSCDPTNLYISLYSSAINPVVNFTCIFYGTGKAGTATKGEKLAVAAKGKNVLSESNPDNFNFHSDYPTLKYDVSEPYSFSASNTTVITIPHNLDYVLFISFNNVLSVLSIVTRCSS